MLKAIILIIYALKEYIRAKKGLVSDRVLPRLYIFLPSIIERLGEVVMQDCFQVVDQKQIIRKAKDRHIFLFEMYLVFCKDVKDTNGKAKYIYKAKFLVSCPILTIFYTRKVDPRTKINTFICLIYIFFSLSK